MRMHKSDTRLYTCAVHVRVFQSRAPFFCFSTLKLFGSDLESLHQNIQAFHHILNSKMIYGHKLFSLEDAVTSDRPDLKPI